MAKDYSEDQLIQKSTAESLEKELGWKSVYAFDQETLGANGTLGRTSYHEVLLTHLLTEARDRMLPKLMSGEIAVDGGRPERPLNCQPNGNALGINE